MYAIKRKLTANQEDEESNHSIYDLLPERNLPVSTLNFRQK
jgi:hypothetical protein